MNSLTDSTDAAESHSHTPDNSTNKVTYIRHFLYNTTNMDKDTSTQLDCPLYKLPMDLFLQILYFCDTAEHVVLSSTSKTLRQVVEPRYPVRKSELWHQEQVETVFGLSQHLPDMAPRFRCSVLHPLNTADIPSDPVCRSCSCYNYRFIPHCAYFITHTHVALALKFTRLGVHQEYLQRLLAGSLGYLPDARGLATVQYESKIVDQRFLLQETMETVEDDAARFISAEPCDHVKFGRLHERKRRAPRSLRPYEPEGYYDDYWDEVRFVFSCKKCRTDAEVTVYNNSWVMRLWKDLGTETRDGQLGHPRFDPCYAKPAPNPRNRGTGRWTPHDKGSIRRMWESGKDCEMIAE